MNTNRIAINLNLFIIIISLFNLKPIEKINKKDFSCDKLMNEAKEFYDNKGEWSGVFKMNPLAWASGGEGICHIRYWYSPVPGSYRTDSGIDYRTFHFQIDRSDGTWKAYSMGDYHSGTLIGEK